MEFVVFPLGGILISSSILWMFRLYMHRQTGPLLQRLEEEFKKILDDSRLDEEVQDLMDKRLDDVIAAFKVQIPMAGMLIGKARENSLKEAAMVELMKLVPSVKDKLAEKVVIGDKAKDMIDHNLHSGRLQQYCGAGLIGAFFGFLEALIL